LAARSLEPLPADIEAAVPRLRRLCAGLDNVTEGLSYDNPTFRRGPKPFAILDRYKGTSCLWLLIDPVLREDQLGIEGWFASPYDPRQLALCCRLDAVDWEAASRLVKASYGLAMPKANK
jgi:hypothetical protein